MNPFELFMIAKLLANQADSDAFLRRAVSTMYYAMFHDMHRRRRAVGRSRRGFPSRPRLAARMQVGKSPCAQKSLQQ